MTRTRAAATAITMFIAAVAAGCGSSGNWFIGSWSCSYADRRLTAQLTIGEGAWQVTHDGDSASGTWTSDDSKVNITGSPFEEFNGQIDLDTEIEAGRTITATGQRKNEWDGNVGQEVLSKDRKQLKFTIVNDHTVRFTRGHDHIECVKLGN